MPLATEILSVDVIALLTGASVGSFIFGYALARVLGKGDDVPRVPAPAEAASVNTATAYDSPRPGSVTPPSPPVQAAAPVKADSERIIFSAPATSGRLVSAIAGVARGAADRSGRYERGSTSGKFIPAGPVATHDFEKWKDKKLVDELQDENTELTNLFTLLPGLTKRITETQKKRDLAPLLADMVVRLCIPPPEKVMVFFVSKAKKELVLAAKVGYREDEVSSNLRIPIEAGRIGRAIKRQVPLDQKDFEREHRQEPIAPVDYYFKTEIAAPMIHNKEVVGVLSAEGFPSYNKNAKKMLAVSANLGGIAIANAEFVQTIQRLADSDALTGLYNKRYFYQRLDEELDRARISTKPLSIFMFDVDHFKKYNDRNGHQAGDEALRMTGQILNERKRETDIAARYGGEEFICILPETGKEGAFTFAESIRKTIEAAPYPHAEAQPLGRVTISGGVATYPDDGTSASALIEVADACLYKSKEKGRNAITRQ